MLKVLHIYFLSNLYDDPINRSVNQPNVMKDRRPRLRKMMA